MRINRRPHNAAFLGRCIMLAMIHPEWSIPQIEAEATKIGLDVSQPKVADQDAYSLALEDGEAQRRVE